MSSIATVEIAAIGGGGDGIAEVEGRRIYAPFTLPGELAEVCIDGDRGAVQRILRSSPERVEPFCRYFGTCGGCQFQHWTSDRYRAWKRQSVEQALRHAKVEAEVSPIVDARGKGRRRVTLRSRKDGAGFNVSRTHRVLDIEACPILVPELRPAFDIARAVHLVAGDCDVAVTASDTGLDVAVKAHRSASPPKLAPVASRFDLARLALNGEEVVTLRPPELLIGKTRVRLPVRGFLQATAEAERIMAELAQAACGKAKSIADLFCGIGPFTLRMAEKAKVLAADIDQHAVAALAAATRATQGIKEIRAEQRNLFENPYTPAELDGFDAIVFNPPRAGAEAQAGKIAKCRVPTIVAVSCDPGTFARDAAMLVAGGYRLNQVTPIDQFAWSSHVEIVGVFER
jgi:23S rRNA (uracil1939-C5)-methyltransferase